MSRKLDALVLHHVMGWRDIGDEFDQGEFDEHLDEHKYSSSIAAAWEVAEKNNLSLVKIKNGWVCFVADIRHTGWLEICLPSEISKEDRSWVSYEGIAASTEAPLAISIAALKAVGVPESEIDAALKGE